jgi:hypothetical protein
VASAGKVRHVGREYVIGWHGVVVIRRDVIYWDVIKGGVINWVVERGR